MAFIFSLNQFPKDRDDTDWSIATHVAFFKNWDSSWDFLMLLEKIQGETQDNQ